MLPKTHSTTLCHNFTNSTKYPPKHVPPVLSTHFTSCSPHTPPLALLQLASQPPKNSSKTPKAHHITQENLQILLQSPHYKMSLPAQTQLHIITYIHLNWSRRTSQTPRKSHQGNHQPSRLEHTRPEHLTPTSSSKKSLQHQKHKYPRRHQPRKRTRKCGLPTMQKRKDKSVAPCARASLSFLARLHSK